MARNGASIVDRVVTEHMNGRADTEADAWVVPVRALPESE
jgi:hypothetical protein